MSPATDAHGGGGERRKGVSATYSGNAVRGDDDILRITRDERRAVVSCCGAARIESVRHDRGGAPVAVQKVVSSGEEVVDLVVVRRNHGIGEVFRNLVFARRLWFSLKWRSPVLQTEVFFFVLKIGGFGVRQICIEEGEGGAEGFLTDGERRSDSGEFRRHQRRRLRGSRDPVQITFNPLENSGDRRLRRAAGWFFRRSCRRSRGRRRSAENRRGETAGVEGVSGEEAANGLERGERETGGGRDADRRSFSGEVAGVIRNHRDDFSSAKEEVRVRIQCGGGCGKQVGWRVV
ncbi:hypothetical protein U1Q18_032106 [Sarracenia purpurea var. burkii]